MDAATPVFAEQVIDLRTITETFQGKEYPVVTGRVVLHAMSPAADLALCGCDATALDSVARPWDESYLPHLPRRAGCAGVDALRAVVARHDLRRWMFTDLVLVDEGIRGGFSHPLTINPDLLLLRPAGALATFLHEQLHWLQMPGLDAATTKAGKRWPDPPPMPAGGHDAESSWLHLSLCALKYRSLGEVIGNNAAAAELAQHKYYAWIYEKILADPGWFADFLNPHELRVPAEIPVPRRYYGDDWWNLV